MKRIFHFKMTTTRILALGFLVGILIGSALLTLPIATQSGEVTRYEDSLFVATSALCVTGLTPIVTAEHWSFFGQAVILVLMQFGGLGVVTFTTTVLLILGKRITLTERILIQDSYNLDSINGVVRMTKRIIKGTFLVELMGALLYSIIFIPRYGVAEGIWKSVFHAVSAFCNAGLDTIGANGLMEFQTNVMINITTMLLIILGGIGFPVWWDILRIAKEVRKKEIPLRDAFRKTTLHTKIVLTMTATLIFGGALLLFLFEYSNPQTLGELSFGNKAMASLFESVTLRTAGFQTIPQEGLTEASSILAVVIMFIGGSPSGTAGGVKTVTIMIILLSMMAAVKGNNEVRAFHRKISDNYVRRGVAVVVISMTSLIVVAMLLSLVEDAGFLDILFESVSALATVGLTRGMTPTISSAGKMILIVAMYIGRIGPITMALAFNAKKYEGKKTLPEGKVIIG